MQWQKEFVFYGDQVSPFLAPRGVCLYNNLLAVSDTGQNRILVWKHLEKQSHQIPDVVLGQQGPVNTRRNSNGEADACSLQYPSGIWTDGKSLIVADAWNHRVLIWHTMPTRNGQAADVVVGQSDFSSVQPNRTGIGVVPDAGSLYWPYGVWIRDNKMWIADTGNRRVLYFDAIPQKNGTEADAVIGQPDMGSRDYDPKHAIWPYSVKTDHQGRLLITDTQFYRIMLWHNERDALKGMQADVLIGQPAFNANGQNQFGIRPASNTLNWTYDACFINEGIAVADTGNSRIMHWLKMPAVHNSPAQEQLGQPDFNTNGETSLSMNSKVPNEMYWPFAVQYHLERLIVADTGNHRIIFYKNL